MSLSRNYNSKEKNCWNLLCMGVPVHYFIEQLRNIYCIFIGKECAFLYNVHGDQQDLEKIIVPLRENTKWQVSYSIVSHQKALYNQFVPWLCIWKSSGHIDILNAVKLTNFGKSWELLGELPELSRSNLEYTTAFLAFDWLYFLWR